MTQYGLRLLCFDGGGVRGLSSLYILRHLMDKLQSLDSNATEPLKPCDVFDMIGGTSTGGLIAVMLGRLKMTVDECIKAYLDLSNHIFAPQDRKWSRIKPRLDRDGLHIDVQSRYSSDKLEEAIKVVIREAGLENDSLLKSPDADDCKVFVCAADRHHYNVTLRSYQSPEGNDFLDRVKIWEACRATSAAQGYFKSMQIDDEIFTDGGILQNNPIRILCEQACHVWARGETPEKDLQAQLKCIISIGTGVPEMKDYDSSSATKLLKAMKRIATDTERQAQDFAHTDIGRDARYFRFNVDHGLNGISLDECQKKGAIIAATRFYCQQVHITDKLRSCATALAGRRHIPNAIILQGNCAESSTYATPFTLEGIPFVKDRFVDRPSEMKAMEECLLGNRYRSDGRRVYILHGMGGVGKTQLALNFAIRHNARFSSVFWLRGNTRTELHESFIECARRIPKSQIPESSRRGMPKTEEDKQRIVQDVLAWLRESKNCSWLMIFDNIDLDHGQEEHVRQGSFDIRQYMPGNQGSIIITTRLEYIKEYGTSTTLRVVGLQMSRLIFEKWYEGDLANQDDSSILLGNSILNGLPLAIAGAAVYMRRERCSVYEYLQLWEKQWNYVTGLGVVPSSARGPSDYPAAMATTWELSLERVRSTAPFGAAAVELLNVWAFLDNNSFWHDLLREVKRQRISTCEASVHGTPPLDMSPSKQPKGKLKQGLPSWLVELSRHETHFLGAMGLLVDYGLAERSQVPSNNIDMRSIRSFSIHPVLHTWAMQRQSRSTRITSLNLSLALFNSLDTYNEDDLATRNRFLSHANSALKWTVAVLNDSKSLELAQPIMNLAGGIYGLSGVAQMLWAVGHKQECQIILELLEKHADPTIILPSNEEDATTLWESRITALNLLGGLLVEKGQYSTAKSKYQEALEISKRHDPGSLKSYTWSTRECLGIVHMLLGEFEEAENCLFDQQSTLDSVPEDLRNAYYNRYKLFSAVALARCNRYQKHLEIARHQMESVLAGIDENQMGWIRREALFEMGKVYRDMHNYEGSERYFRLCLDKDVELIGLGHPDTRISGRWLCVALEKQGKLQESDEVQQMLGISLQHASKVAG